jgi:heme/copper-type cytochrome/quinol oxidase subunit 2
MRLIVLAMCGVVAGGVAVAVFLSIWSTSDAATRAPVLRQRLAKELVWAAIPCLMILAAAIPAVLAILLAHVD